MQKLSCSAIRAEISAVSFFLHPQSEALAKINKWLQTPSLSLHCVYSKIKALLTTFIQPVTLDASKSVSDPANRLQQPDLHALINRFSQEGGLWSSPLM